MINTFIMFLFKQSTLSAVIYLFIFYFVVYVCMLYSHVVMYSWCSCDADIYQINALLGTTHVTMNNR